MNVDTFANRLSAFFKFPKSVQTVHNAANAASKAATSAVKSAKSAIPNYAAVKVNGLVVFMPVDNIPKGAEIVKGGLNSLDDIMKAMATHHNTVSLK